MCWHTICKALRHAERQVLACSFSLSLCTAVVTPDIRVRTDTIHYSLLFFFKPPRRYVSHLVCAWVCPSKAGARAFAFLHFHMDECICILHKCNCVFFFCSQFIVMKSTDNFGYISLGACQAALKLVAQRYVIVLSPQTRICMKKVTSGFLLLSINHLKQIRQRQIQLSLLQYSQWIFVGLISYLSQKCMGVCVDTKL